METRTRVSTVLFSGKSASPLSSGSSAGKLLSPMSPFGGSELAAITVKIDFGRPSSTPEEEEEDFVPLSLDTQNETPCVSPIRNADGTFDKTSDKPQKGQQKNGRDTESTVDESPWSKVRESLDLLETNPLDIMDIDKGEHTGTESSSGRESGYTGMGESDTECVLADETGHSRSASGDKNENLISKTSLRTCVADDAVSFWCSWLKSSVGCFWRAKQGKVNHSPGASHSPETHWMEQLRSYVQRGIPSHLRARVWKKLTGVDTRREVSGKLYQTLQEQVQFASSLDIEQIEKDLPRTLLASAEEMAQLRRILLAYSLFNPTTGYCQSMNFLCMPFLKMLEEEDIFWMLEALEDLTSVHTGCEKKGYPRVVSYYQHNLAGSHIDQRVFLELFQERMPDVWAAFQELCIPLDTITWPWFLSLFSTTLPTETLERVWDCLFLEGIQFLFRLGLAIVSNNRSRVLQAESFEDLIEEKQSFSLAVDIDTEQLIRLCYAEELGSIPVVFINSVRQRHAESVLRMLDPLNNFETNLTKEKAARSKSPAMPRPHSVFVRPSSKGSFRPIKSKAPKPAVKTTKPPGSRTLFKSVLGRTRVGKISKGKDSKGLESVLGVDEGVKFNGIDYSRSNSFARSSSFSSSSLYNSITRARGKTVDASRAILSPPGSQGSRQRRSELQKIKMDVQKLKKHSEQVVKQTRPFQTSPAVIRPSPTSSLLPPSSSSFRRQTELESKAEEHTQICLRMIDTPPSAGAGPYSGERIMRCDHTSGLGSAIRRRAGGYGSSGFSTPVASLSSVSSETVHRSGGSRRVGSSPLGRNYVRQVLTSSDASSESSSFHQASARKPTKVYTGPISEEDELDDDRGDTRETSIVHENQANLSASLPGSFHRHPSPASATLSTQRCVSLVSSGNSEKDASSVSSGNTLSPAPGPANEHPCPKRTFHGWSPACNNSCATPDNVPHFFSTDCSSFSEEQRYLSSKPLSSLQVIKRSDEDTVPQRSPLQSITPRCNAPISSGVLRRSPAFSMYSDASISMSDIPSAGEVTPTQTRLDPVENSESCTFVHLSPSSRSPDSDRPGSQQKRRPPPQPALRKRQNFFDASENSLLLISPDLNHDLTSASRREPPPLPPKRASNAWIQAYTKKYERSDHVDNYVYNLAMLTKLKP
eukprot:g5850.t1